jgi:signal transduction histidine kinase
MVSIRKQIRSALTSSKSVGTSDLKNANEELYKRNLELAVKNRTLSLLQQLYDISNRELIPKVLAHKLVQSISKGLELPFVAILSFDKKTKQLSPLATASHDTRYHSRGIDGNKNHYFTINTKRKGQHVFADSLRTGKMQQSSDFLGVMNPFLNKKAALLLSEDIAIKNVLSYPLLVNKKQLGVLVVALKRVHKDLNVFEIDSLNSLVNVVNVALDKALIYEDLKKANDILLTLDKQKTEFLSIASHQFRTPLSIIKGYLELITDGAYGRTTKKMRHVLGDMDESNERLVKLIDGFLDISRIEQGRTKYLFEKINLNITITSVVKELEGRAKSKGLSLLWKEDTDISEVMYDEEKIRHVIFNFTDNAIKYCNDGNITISLKIEKNGIVVRVKDTGIGFDKDDGKNLFQKFYRAKNAEASNVGGTGLGIYVCRKFVEAHDGEVWSRSDGVGKGSEFGFWIPLKQKKPERHDKKSRGVTQDIAVQYSTV